MRVTEPYIIFPRTLKSGKVVYYYQFRLEDGSRSSALSTGETSLSKARRKIQKMYNAGEFQKQAKGVLFSEYVSGFFDKSGKYYQFQSVTGKPIKDSTIASYNNLLEREILPFFKDFELAKINKTTIKDWIVWANEFWSAKTINNAHGVLSIILQSALESSLIPFNPVSGVRFRPVEKKERQLLTVAEISQIYHSELWGQKSQKRKMFLLAAITGMRIGEVSGLKKTDVFENYLDVKRSFSDKFGEGSTKTGICRKVPIVDNFDFGESSTEWLFEGLTQDKPVLSHSVYKTFVQICDNLKIDRKERGITIHSLRNFFISYLQSENVSESKIKAVVGHKDKSNMTDHYTYWSVDMLKEVYEVQKRLYEKIVNESNENH